MAEELNTGTVVDNTTTDTPATEPTVVECVHCGLDVSASGCDSENGICAVITDYVSAGEPGIIVKLLHQIHLMNGAYTTPDMDEAAIAKGFAVRAEALYGIKESELSVVKATVTEGEPLTSVEITIEPCAKLLEKFPYARLVINGKEYDMTEGTIKYINEEVKPTVDLTKPVSRIYINWAKNHLEYPKYDITVEAAKTDNGEGGAQNGTEIQ